MDSPSRVYFGDSDPSHFRCDPTIFHASSKSLAAEISSSARGVCDRPHQVFAKDLPLYDVEVMSLIHEQIARLAWPSIMAASRGKVLTLDAQRPGNFAWGPFWSPLGHRKASVLFCGASSDCNQRGNSSPIYRSRTAGLCSSLNGALRIWRNAFGIQVIQMRRTIAC